MPCEYNTTSWEKSLFKLAEESKKTIGCDGKYSLPVEKRVLLDVAYAGQNLMLMRVIKKLELNKEDARNLYFGLISQDMPNSITEVDDFLNNIRKF